jgi:hypothetical protein
MLKLHNFTYFSNNLCLACNAQYSYYNGVSCIMLRIAAMADDILLALISGGALCAVLADDFVRLCQARYRLPITGRMDRTTLATLSAAERTEYFRLLLGGMEL